MAEKSPTATEQRNPSTRGLDAKSTIDILRAIHREDATVAKAVARAIPAIAKAVDAIAQALQHGGRLIYIGAGTSGRLAALDAAEIPPTFGTPSRYCRGAPCAHPRSRTRGRQSYTGRDRPSSPPADSQRRRRGYHGQRLDAVRTGGAQVRAAARRFHHRSDVEPANVN